MTSPEDAASMECGSDELEEALEDLDSDDLEKLDDALPPPPKPYAFNPSHGPIARRVRRRRISTR